MKLLLPDGTALLTLLGDEVRARPLQARVFRPWRGVPALLAE